MKTTVQNENNNSYLLKTSAFRLHKIATAVCVVALLTGCQNMNNREAGTALGAVAGGVAGAFFGKGAGKAVAIMAGTAIGGFIGNQIGASLDEQQKAAIAQTSANALNTAAAGQTITWNDGKAQAQITAGKTQYEPKTVVVVRDRKVEPPPALQLVGTNHKVTGSAPVRLAANAKSEVATTLKKGDTIHVVGRVEGTKYSLVSRNRKSIGYVETAKLTEAPQSVQTASLPAAKTAAPAPAAPPALRQAVDLDAAPDAAQTAATAQGVDLDADEAIADKVVASVPCRSLTTQVSVEGQSDTATSKACKAADGAWEL